MCFYVPILIYSCTSRLLEYILASYGPLFIKGYMIVIITDILCLVCVE